MDETEQQDNEILRRRKVIICSFFYLLAIVIGILSLLKIKYWIGDIGEIEDEEINKYRDIIFYTSIALISISVLGLFSLVAVMIHTLPIKMRNVIDEKNQQETVYYFAMDTEAYVIQHIITILLLLSTICFGVIATFTLLMLGQLYFEYKYTLQDKELVILFVFLIVTILFVFFGISLVYYTNKIYLNSLIEANHYNKDYSSGEQDENNTPTLRRKIT